MFSDKRKVLGSIIGAIMFLSVIFALTYAFYEWRSSDTAVSFNISDPSFSCESGTLTKLDDLTPVLYYQDGSYQTFKVDNAANSSKNFSVTLNITSIDESLKSESLKYKLLADTTGGNNDCSVVGSTSCVEVDDAEGDFSEFDVGVNSLVPLVTIPADSEYLYYLFIYIDGSVENDIAMQESSITSTIDVCGLSIVLDYNDGTTNQVIDITDSSYVLPTGITKADAVITYYSNGASSTPNTQTISYTFDGWYLEEDFQTLITEINVDEPIDSSTVYAKWNPSTTVILPTVTKDGYNFLGWYSDEALQNRIGGAGESYVPEKSVTLYAGWSANTNVVTLNKGTGISAVGGAGTYNVGEEVTVTATVQDGYTFGGWSGTSTSSDLSYTFTMPDSAVNLSASANANIYTVSYNGNNSTSGSTASSTHTYDVIKSLNTNGFSRIGYKFKNWNTAADGSGSSFVDGADVINLTNQASGAVTLYAQWEPITYTITYNGNGSTSGSMNPSNHVYGVSKYLSANAYTRTDYIFDGWNTSSDGSGTSYTNGELVSNLTTVDGSNITLYAQWAYGSFLVNFNPNRGSVGTLSKTVAHNSAYGDLPTPTRTGYTFDGWYDTIELGTKSLSASSTNYSYVSLLYGVAPGDTYTITMDSAVLSAGSATQFTLRIHDFTLGTTLKDVIVNFSNSTILVDIACPSTATFGNDIRVLVYAGIAGSTSGNTVSYNNIRISGMGTSTATQYTSSSTMTLNRNHTLIAKWTPNTYTVSYNGNNSTSGSTASSTHTYDVAKTLTSNGFTRKGYNFAGWNTVAAGTGTAYTNGQSVSNLTSTNNGTVTLYAQWTPKILTMTLDKKGGTGGTSTIYEKYGLGWYSNSTATTAISSITIPTYTGKNFNGYYYTNSSGTEYQIITSAGAITASNTFFSVSNTIYAKWTTKTYTIKYDANGGSGVPANQTKTYGVNLTLASTPTPTRAGYTFLGYSTSSSATTASYQPGGTYSSNAAATLYAVWDKNYLNEKSVGTYVSYTGNNGCSGTACSGANVSAGYCRNSSYTYDYSGWRILYIKSNTVYLTTGGSPECMCTNEAESAVVNTGCSSSMSWDTDGASHLANLNARALKYCNATYAYGGACSSTSAWQINATDWNNVLGVTLASCWEVSSTACGTGNNLINNGGFYWFSTHRADYYTYMWDGSVTMVQSYSSNVNGGLRPIIRLKSSVYVTGGSGTAASPWTISS